MKAARGLHLGEVLFGNNALGDERLAGEQFDLQPDFQLALLAPDLPHFRPRITLNHAASLRRGGCRVEKGVPPARLAFGHLGAGRLQNLAFAVGQAVDAVRGNFVEDGVHFRLMNSSDGRSTGSDGLARRGASGGLKVVARISSSRRERRFISCRLVRPVTQ